MTRRDLRDNRNHHNMNWLWPLLMLGIAVGLDRSQAIIGLV
jgi:hypothetical protein